MRPWAVQSAMRRAHGPRHGSSTMTAMQKLGRLTRIDAREVWTHEAHDFTPWLHDNIALLAEALGFDIEATGREVAVRDFSVDVVGKTTPGGRSVIVENQLASTDHSHLGQLLTYASGLEAAVIVWLAPRFRDERRQVLDWLNAHTVEGIDFFGVELELLRIDDSAAAPHFKLVAQPNEWAKTTREAASPSQPNERGLRYQRFFEALLTGFKAQRPNLTSASRVGPDSWFGFSGGRTGFSFVWAVVGSNRLRVEMYIDTGEQASSKAFFDALKARAAELAAKLQSELAWERLDNRRASRIATYRPLPEAPPLDANEDLKAWAIATMVRWNDVLRPIVKTLVPQPAAEIEGPSPA
jgi:hypothetical protein